MKKFKIKSNRVLCEIPTQVWFDHFSSLYRVENPRAELLICDVGHEKLDSAFTELDIKNILCKPKKNKARGLDVIPNEVFKYLNDIDYLVSLFNFKSPPTRLEQKRNFLHL